MDSWASPLMALPSVPARSPSDPVLPPSPTRQQELDNLLHEKRYLRALGLAISLDRPHTVLTVIQGQCCLGPWRGGRVLGPSCALPWGSVSPPPHPHPQPSGGTLRPARSWEQRCCGCGEIRKVRGRWAGGAMARQGSQWAGLTVLVPPEALLRFCVTWNTNSRHCHDAQAVLGVLLRHEAPEELLAYPGVQTSLEALLPYTGMWAGPGRGGSCWPAPTKPLTSLCPPPERHFQRLSRTLQAATFLDFLWHNMKLPALPAAPSVAPSAL